MVFPNFEIKKEMLQIITLLKTTKSADIFEATKNAIDPAGGFEKLSSVCTDGAPSMRCHLRAKKYLVETMQAVIEIANKIKGDHNALNNRKFVSFLAEQKTNYKDMLLYTEVRWLGRGKCLERFFA